MLDLYDQIEAASAAIQAKFKETPHAGIILGTGLGGLVEKIDIAETLDYETIPHFPKSTATSHRGRLVCGRLENIPVVVMKTGCDNNLLLKISKDPKIKREVIHKP